MKRFLLIFFVVVLSIGVYGCNKQEESVPGAVGGNIGKVKNGLDKADSEGKLKQDKKKNQEKNQEKSDTSTVDKEEKKGDKKREGKKDEKIKAEEKKEEKKREEKKEEVKVKGQNEKPDSKEGLAKDAAKKVKTAKQEKKEEVFTYESISGEYTATVSLNVREKPGFTNKAIGVLNPGEKAIAKRKTKVKGNGVWFEIELPNKKQGGLILPT